MVVQSNTLLRAVLYAQAAFDAGDFAGFRNHLLNRVPVGTQDYRALLISRGAFKQSLRTFGGAEHTARTFCIIHFGQPVPGHCQRVKFARLHAVAKTQAAPGAEFDPAGDFRATAGLQSGVGSL